MQAYEIVAVRDPVRKRELAGAAFGQDFIAAAAVVLVFCARPARSAAKYGARGEELYCIQDATIAAAYAQLAATALGLGACWVGALDEAAVARVIGAKGLRPIAIMPIGWPAERPARTPRRPLSELVHEEI